MGEKQRPKAGGGGRQNQQYRQKSFFKGPTSGHEKEVFGYGANFTPDTFKRVHEALTKYVGCSFKRGGGESTAALRSGTPPLCWTRRRTR